MNGEKTIDFPFKSAPSPAHLPNSSLRLRVCSVSVQQTHLIDEFKVTLVFGLLLRTRKIQSSNR